MNCSNCNETLIQWSGEVVKVGNRPMARLEARCIRCRRTFVAQIEWKLFALVEKGSETKKPPVEPKDLVPIEQVQAFNKSFRENFGKGI